LPESLESLRSGDLRADGRIGLRIDDWQRLEQVLADLRLAGCKIEEMELEHTDLEDVFVRIMNEPHAGPGAAPAVEAAR
jgi:ABC-2 type transport system ATP-binding protein